MPALERVTFSELPPLIEQLKRFIEKPKPGEKPLVYFATRQTDFDYPERDKSKPNLYRADQLSIDQFMAEVFPYSEYGDYRDLKKAEEWVMPGFDCYVVPFELPKKALDWSFGDELAAVFRPMIQGGPNWDEAIDEALGVEKPTDEDQAMFEGFQKHMAILLPIFQNSGPLDLPHFHASVCFGLDNYAQGWLDIEPYQVMHTNEARKSPAQLFNERYGRYNLRYGRMMTVRYTSYKPGKLDALYGQLQATAIRELGGEPDLLQERAATIADKLDVLQADEIFNAYWQQQTFSSEKSEVQVVGDYLSQLPIDHLQRDQFQELYDQLSSLDQFVQQAEDLARQHFDEICQVYFGLTAEEFEQAYQIKLEWLIKEKDKVLVDMAQRLGVSAMLEKNSYDTGWFRPLTIEDFPSGGIILNQNEDPSFNGKPSKMVIAYPAINPAEDLPTICEGQFSKSIEEVALRSKGIIFITNDQELNGLRDQYIQGQLKYPSQYQSFTASDVVSGSIDLETINESTEVLLINGFGYQQDSQIETIKSFIVNAWRKIAREGRRTGLEPKIIVFADNNQLDSTVLPEGFIHGHLSKSEREIMLRPNT